MRPRSKSLSQRRLRVCVVTGSRSEYGLLQPLMKKFQDSDRFELRVVATGAHLWKKFGETWRQIEKDGFKIDAKVGSDLDQEDPESITRAVGEWTAGFGKVFAETKPDLVVVLGDRYELLAVASACTLSLVPVAHISGGEITEGAIDDSIRHAMTKLSHLHFVTNEAYATRVRQLGEECWRICVSGEPGLDAVTSLKPLSKAELETDLGLDLSKPTAMVTFHPVTLESEQLKAQLAELKSALQNTQLNYLITYPNADPGSDEIIETWKSLQSDNPARIKLVDSLGHRRFLSLLPHVLLMIGNSSSGLVEAPLFNLPVVNIGDRQKGRIRGSNVRDVGTTAREILEGICWAESYDRGSACDSPYGDGRSSDRIIEKILAVFGEKDASSLLKKKFVDIGTKSEMNPVRYVGGSFELDRSLLSAPVRDWRSFFRLGADALLTCSGRSAFRAILEEISPGQKTVLVPEYLCGDAQIPVLKELGIHFQFYPVTQDLRVEAPVLAALVDGNTAAVVLVNYFGVVDHSAVATALRAKRKDLVIVLDAAQDLYSFHFGQQKDHWADFAFISFQKFGPVPDGGAARSRSSFKRVKIESAAPWQGAEYLAGALLKGDRLRSQFPRELTSAIEAEYLALFEQAQSKVSPKLQGISALSEHVLAHCDFAGWAEKRRKNFEFLRSQVSRYSSIRPIFTEELSTMQVPLAFPVRVEKGRRDALRNHLRSNGFFCPVHWPSVPEVDAFGGAARVISESILSLPIDQRAGFSDLQALLDRIDEFAGRK